LRERGRVRGAWGRIDESIEDDKMDDVDDKY